MAKIATRRNAGVIAGNVVWTIAESDRSTHLTTGTIDAFEKLVSSVVVAIGTGSRRPEQLFRGSFDRYMSSDVLRDAPRRQPSIHCPYCHLEASLAMCNSEMPVHSSQHSASGYTLSMTTAGLPMVCRILACYSTPILLTRRGQWRKRHAAQYIETTSETEASFHSSAFREKVLDGPRKHGYAGGVRSHSITSPGPFARVYSLKLPITKPPLSYYYTAATNEVVSEDAVSCPYVRPPHQSPNEAFLCQFNS
ncbi:hypothetical protein NUW54_g10590 [Trametes sanguinea]|uniref:Uncharacterized protein n=1 Tax=Trametes sanguinea TaxID=158606 RepID=A0ACC1NWY4_9APHY|nr:hypothetical protein NUW54_g10590 [Trametes sanguinea]